MLKKLLPVEKGFLPYLLTMAAPIAIESALYIAVSVTDVIMIGHYNGEIGMASIALAAQVFFGVLMLIFSFGSAAGIFFSRLWGAKEPTELRATFGLTTFIVVAISILLGVVLYLLASPIMAIMIGAEGDALILAYGTQYLSIVALTIPLFAFSVMVSGLFRSVEKSSYPMWITAIVIPINIFLNWVFIFGNLGVPQMGIMGAAIATLIVRILDVILNLILLLSAKNPVAGPMREYFKFFIERNFSLVGRFFKMAIPLAGSDIVWALAITFYQAAYARAGTEVVAAFVAMNSLMQVFFVVFFGFGWAGNIILGITIGENDIKKARNTANILIRLNFIIAIPMGLIMLAISPFVPAIFNLSDNTATYMLHAIIITGVLLSIRSLEFVLGAGILRAGGDAKWLLIIQSSTMWLLGVPILFLMVYFGMPPFLLYLVVVGEEVVRVGFYLLRYRTGRWIKQV